MMIYIESPISSLWVFNNKKDLLIAERPVGKSDAGKFTESAVGTVEAGETYETNLVKEAYEELGMRIDSKDLVYIAKEFYKGKHGQMFGAMYAVLLDEETPTLNINTAEVPSVEWISYDQVVEELKKDDIKLVGGFDKFYFQVWEVIKDL